MPTSYTGNPAAGAEGASPAPDPENAPIVTMPVAAEAVAVAGVQQAWKTLADHLAFLKLPRAKTSAWTQMVRTFRNAKLRAGFVIDHDGMPAGRIFELNENWNSNAIANTISTGRMGPWLYRIAGGTPAGVINNGGAGASLSAVPWGPLAVLSFNTGHAETLLLEYAVPLMRMSTTSFSMAFDFSIIGTPAASSDFAIGLGDGSLFADVSNVGFNTGGGPSPVGAAIYASAGMPIVTSYTRAVAGSPATVVLLNPLTSSVPHRIKIQILGTDSADDSTAKVQFFLDGSLIATTSVDMLNANLVPFIRMTTSDSDTTALAVGPIQFRGRLALGDVSL